MKIGTGAPARISGNGGADAVPSPRTQNVRCLPVAYEAMLCQVDSHDVCFDVFARAERLNDLIGSQGYLTHGWLAADSACPGPVIKLREEAVSPDGVVFGEDNLGLGNDVFVLGMRDAQGGADSYFLCQWPAQAPIKDALFFDVCIESGRITGRHEIYVHGPLKWDAFLEYLRE